jgi:hypothetical protein
MGQQLKKIILKVVYSFVVRANTPVRKQPPFCDAITVAMASGKYFGLGRYQNASSLCLDIIAKAIIN